MRIGRTSRLSLSKSAGALVLFATIALALTSRATNITPLRTPHNGIEPQLATYSVGTLHLIYFKGDDRHGDIFYARSTDGGTTFSPPLRVNSQPDSAVAIGAVRGATLAI